MPARKWHPSQATSENSLMFFVWRYSKSQQVLSQQRMFVLVGKKEQKRLVRSGKKSCPSFIGKL